MTPTTTEVVRAAFERCGGVCGVVSGMAAAWQGIGAAIVQTLLLEDGVKLR